MTAHADLLNQLHHRKPGHTLPRAFYTDPAIYRQDLELIFYRDWLFAGHDCELAKPGAYFTMRIGDYPVVVLRDRRAMSARSTTPAAIAAHASAPRTAARRASWSARITAGLTNSTAACPMPAIWARISTRPSTG